MSSEIKTEYHHLEARPGSNYRALWLKGRRIRAAVVDETINGVDPMTPEEFASDFRVSLEAVLEALEYVANNQAMIEADRDGEAASLRAMGFEVPERE